MSKVSSKYLETDPWRIVEKGFHKEKNEVSESLFSLSNEYMGVRGFFEEGSSLPSLIGTYFNGIIEYSLEDRPSAYKGIVKRTHFTINSVNFLKCSLSCGGEKLDLATSAISSFERVLDLKNGLLGRSFVWHANGGDIEVVFERILDMVNVSDAVQRITLKSNQDVQVQLSLSLDSSILHWGNHCYWDEERAVDPFEGGYGLSMKTPRTHQGLVAVMDLEGLGGQHVFTRKEKEIEVGFALDLKANEEKKITRFVSIEINKESSSENEALLTKATRDLQALKAQGFGGVVASNADYFAKVWERSDVEIDGDIEDQQGIRYCIFQLEQTYHGVSPDNNIGDKGLTGEAYSGHAFWDSETYCLPYYLFSNQQSALNLLSFRYHTLEQAKARAKDLDCEGACYPIATRNGEEACDLWQHASCQFQPSTGVAYAIAHYMNLYHDDAFMQKQGLEMLLEIDKFLLSRGQYSPDGRFGFYGVMGPDEFELMVNNNTYTNFMAKKSFEYLFEILASGRYETKDLLKKCGYDSELLQRMKDASEKMIILYDPKTQLFEEHDGYFKLPHIDIHSIPVEDFPLYSHWSYDRIYRNDIIKQPDVLMFMFLYPSDFSASVKKANYDFYEPRCIHESSLSPSIHSIFACGLGYEKAATDFFAFATRLDLDDYNRNTKEGLHLTSIAAAWMNIVYGFLGLKSDQGLSIAPILPKKWVSYSVRLSYRGTRFKVSVNNQEVSFALLEGAEINLAVYGKEMTIRDGTSIKR